MKYKICYLCTAVSGIWLALSAGVAFGLLGTGFLLPIALLMGGSVVGISNKLTETMSMRGLLIAVGMPAAYLLVANISPVIVITEAFLLACLGHFIFRKGNRVKMKNDKVPEELESKLSNCCD